MKRDLIMKECQNHGLVKKVDGFGNISFHKPYRRGRSKRSTFIIFKGKDIETYTMDFIYRVFLYDPKRDEIKISRTELIEIISKL